ncbi:MAG: SUMF1/EgtB/PvdO family nonheme iron enzyme [Gammaproteobacteria bacterium]
MSDLSLRDLARRYADGRMDRDEYRRRRAALLSAIVEGSVGVGPGADEDPTTDAVTGPTNFTITPVTAPERTAPPPRKRSGLAVAAIGAFAVAIGGWWFFGRGTPVPDTAPASQAAPSIPVPELVSGFLEHPDWSPAGIDGLHAGWLALPAQARAPFEGSQAKAELADGIYQQLAEERTVAGVDPNLQSVERQTKLAALASAFSIQDPRIEEVVAALEARRTELAAASAAQPAQDAAPQAAQVQTTTASPRTPAPATTEDVTTPAAATAAANTAPPAQPAQAAPAPVPTPVTAPVPAVGAAATAATAPPAKPAPTTEDAPAAPAPSVAAGDGHGCNAALGRTRRPFCRDRLGTAGEGPLMVVLVPGEFTMGGTKASEQPSRKVRIGYALAVAAYETTAGEMQRFCKASGHPCPGQPWNDAGYPAVNVTWNDAVAYAQWLARQTGRPYRLPTEAEWEFAARAGTTTAYPSGEDLLPTDARFSYHGPVNSPLPISDRSINRNRFRLFHMVGNVREWVADAWHDSHAGAPADGSARSGGTMRVVRGGSFRNGADALRSAAREPRPADGSDDETGFRVVLALDDAAR